MLLFPLYNADSNKVATFINVGWRAPTGEFGVLLEDSPLINILYSVPAPHQVCIILIIVLTGDLLNNNMAC